MMQSKRPHDAIRYWTPWILLSVQALAYILLFNGRFRPEAHVAVAFLLSQCATLTLASAPASLHPALRFAGPVLAVSLCWFGIRRLLFIGYGDEEGACWAIAVVTLALVAKVSFHLFGYQWHTPSLRVDGSPAPPPIRTRERFQFPVAMLIGMTTLVALALASIRLGEEHGLWTFDSMSIKAALTWLTLGGMLGLLAVACFAATTQNGSRQTCIAFVKLLLLAFFGGLACFQFAEMAGQDQSESPRGHLALLFAYCGWLVPSLFLMHRVARWGDDDTVETSASDTQPERPTGRHASS